MAEEEFISNHLSTIQEDYARLQDHLITMETDSQNAFASKLLNVIADLFDQPQYSDLEIFLQGGVKLWGHKLVLLGRGDDWGLSNLSYMEELDLRDINYDVAYAMIKWVYTDDLDIKMEDIFLLELLQVATKYKLESLHIRCQKELMNVVTEENSTNISKMAKEQSADMLLAYCQQCFPKPQDLDDLTVTMETLLPDELQDNENPLQSQFEAVDMETVVKIEQENESELTTGTAEFSCNVCDKSFIRSGNLIRHKEVHHQESPYTCSACKKGFCTDVEMTSHNCETSKNNTSDSKCDVCSKTFSTMKKLEQHVKSHEVEKCDVCDKTFFRKGSLKIHRKLHTEPFSVNCDVCTKSFSSYSNLQRHMKIHIGEKAFVCDECGQRFSQNHDLQRHYKIHTGEMGFKCDVCGKQFNRSSTLNKHHRTHTNLKPYSCTMCSKTFTSSSSLCRHVRLHKGMKPFSCEVCFKMFISRSDLQRHARVHLGDAQYECSFCERSFRLNRELQDHTKIHTGETMQYVEFNIQEDPLTNDPSASIFIEEYNSS